MAEINDDIKHVIDANKDRMFKEKQKVKRIEFGEVLYKFEEIFNTPEEAHNKDKQGEYPKFTVLEKKVERVNIKTMNNEELNIERGKDNVQSESSSADKNPTTTGSGKNAQI